MSDFNPSDHLIQLRVRGGPATEYLPVAARIAWFRDTHPDGAMRLEAHTISEQIAIFRARVSSPDGGTAEGWGSETPQDFRDYIEKASTKALGRALAALGYGTLQAGNDLDEGERIADTPQPARPARAPVARQEPRSAAGAPAPAPAPARALTEEEVVGLIEDGHKLFEAGRGAEEIYLLFKRSLPGVTGAQWARMKAAYRDIKLHIAVRDEADAAREPAAVSS